MRPCACEEQHVRKRIVLTGGPGAGKTAVLELVRQSFCQHIKVLPEAASILFGGGFPRGEAPGERRAMQRAVYYIQRELERFANEAGSPSIVLCDRGTVDGIAYWPGPGEFWAEVGTSWDEELARYDAVLHLRTPSVASGYNHSNPVRVESAAEAARIDERILRAWERHPRRYVVETAMDFFEKAHRAIEVLRGELPPCCQGHLLRAPEPELDEQRRGESSGH
jgi:predicted ATPase